MHPCFWCSSLFDPLPTRNNLHGFISPGRPGPLYVVLLGKNLLDFRDMVDRICQRLVSVRRIKSRIFHSRLMAYILQAGGSRSFCQVGERKELRKLVSSGSQLPTGLQSFLWKKVVAFGFSPEVAGSEL